MVNRVIPESKALLLKENLSFYFSLFCDTCLKLKVVGIKIALIFYEILINH